VPAAPLPFSAEVDALQTQEASLEEAKTEVQKEQMRQLSLLKHRLDLYINITKIEVRRMLICYFLRLMGACSICFVILSGASDLCVAVYFVSS
jgi:hypothetical protein